MIPNARITSPARVLSFFAVLSFRFSCSREAVKEGENTVSASRRMAEKPGISEVDANANTVSLLSVPFYRSRVAKHPFFFPRFQKPTARVAARVKGHPLLHFVSFHRRTTTVLFPVESRSESIDYFDQCGQLGVADWHRCTSFQGQTRGDRSIEFYRWNAIDTNG